MEEAKAYYSQKHKLHGYKCDVSVLPNGPSIGFTTHYGGKTADIDNFYKNLSFHKNTLCKIREDLRHQDNGLHVAKYPNRLSVMMDKGYRGALGIVKTIKPYKRLLNRILAEQEEHFNSIVAHSRLIIVSYVVGFAYFGNYLVPSPVGKRDFTILNLGCVWR